MQHTETHHEPSGSFTRRKFLAGGLVAPAAVAYAAGKNGGDEVISFGIVADVHYAETLPSGNRYYKNSLKKLREAAQAFQESEVDFVVELGDFIDSGSDKKEETANLREIMTVFTAIGKKPYYVLGNHDLQRFTKKEFLALVNQPQGQFSFDIDGLHCIVLDACFNPDGSPYSRGRFDWTKSFIPESGLTWLADDLRQTGDQPVIVFIHQILHNDTSRHCVVNAPDVRAVLETHGNVRAVVQGHQHFNNHRLINDIHYMTLGAMVSGRTPERNAYAVVHVHPGGRIEVDGYNQRDYQW